MTEAEIDSLVTSALRVGNDCKHLYTDRSVRAAIVTALAELREELARVAWQAQASGKNAGDAILATPVEEE